MPQEQCAAAAAWKSCNTDTHMAQPALCKSGDVWDLAWWDVKTESLATHFNKA
jgi:hypothetical protein